MASRRSAIEAVRRNEIIVSGENGLLCEDGAEALAKALRRLMDDRTLRRAYGEVARCMAEKYHAEKVWGQWERLLRRSLGIRYSKGGVS